MNGVWAITINTFRETVRDRVLYACAVFAVIITLAGMLLGSLSISQNVRVLEDIGMFAISTISGIIAIFIGTNLVFKEMDKRTIYLIFTKPIARWQFIFGKFLGLSLCILLVTAMMGAFLIGLSMLNGEQVSHLGYMCASIGLIYVELLLVIALATFFSTFATPLMSVIFTLALWFCAHLSDSLLELSKLSQSAAVKVLFDGIRSILPDLTLLTRIRFDLIGGSHNFSNDALVLVICYVMAYVVLLLSFGTVITERREFN